MTLAIGIILTGLGVFGFSMNYDILGVICIIAGLAFAAMYKPDK